MPFALPAAPLRLVGLVAALALVATGPSACGGDAPARPNVLVITVDTLRADALGAPTPTLDALAADGLRFTAAESTSSWTLPSLASLMSGTETSTHGCWDMKTRLDDSFETLAERLTAAGYHTGAVASHVFLDPKHGLAQGFEDYDTALVKSLMDSHEAISSPKVTRKSLAWLDARAREAEQRPFLLWSHYFDPHDVYHAHEGFAVGDGTGERARYRSEVAFTDHWIGELLAGLDERGLADDTVVLLVADHGEEFGDHGSSRHGHTLYGELTRVPLYLRLPAQLAADLGIEQGRDVGDLVSVVELLPTLLELCDVAGLDPTLTAGGSLVPLLAGAPGEGREALLEVRLRKNRHADALVRDHMKLIAWRDGRRELYDLAVDPLEQDDLAAVRPEQVAELERRLAERIAIAERRGEVFELSNPLDLSPEELQNLADLGYVDDE